MSISDRDYVHVLDTFFQQDNILVAQQIDSFNTFIKQDIARIVRQHSPFTFTVERSGESIESDDPKIRNIRFLRVKIMFKDTKLLKPKIEETNGKDYELYPNDARLRALTYQSPIFVGIDYSVTMLDRNRNELQTFVIQQERPEKLGFIPVMVRSDICNLHGLSKYGLQQVNEDPYDFGGYFIVKGNEKVIIPQEKRNENYIFLFKNKGDSDFSVVTEIKSVRDDTVSRSVNIKVKYDRRKEIMWVSINPGFSGKDVPLAILFRALGIVIDRDIAQHCIWDLEDIPMLQVLRPSLMFETKDLKSGTITRIRSREEALLYIAERSIPPHQKIENDDDKKKYVIGLIDRYLFPHVIDPVAGVKKKKARFLGLMVRKLIMGKLDLVSTDDRDDLGNKRIDLAGPLLGQILRNSLGNFLDNLKKYISKDFLSKIPTSREALIGLISKTKATRLVDNAFRSALLTGTWKYSRNMLNVRPGVAQLLQRKCRYDTLANLRRVFTPTTSGSGSIGIAAIRRLHSSQIGMIDPLDTPDGAQTGVVKSLAMTCYITIATAVEPILRVLGEIGENLIVRTEELPLENASKMTTIFVNGIWYGSTLNPEKIVNELRARRRRVQIDPHVGIVWDFGNDEIRINTDGGRCVRPVYIVGSEEPKRRSGENEEPKRRSEGNKLKMNKEVLNKLLEEDPLKRWSWNDLIRNGIVEYIDVHESENNTVICKYVSEIGKVDAKICSYTHCEIHPVVMLGVIVGMIPFSEHNQSPRNLFQAGMTKQAINVYATNFEVRMDTAANVLHYPQRPLVGTYVSKITGYDKFPAGQNAMVAIAMYTGYNQEDSVIVNYSSVQRGLFASTSFKSFKEEAKNEERFIKPDPKKTQGMKSHANYDKLNNFGIVPEGTRVEKNDVLIGKVSQLDRSQRSGEYEQSDNSVIMKEGKGTVDKIITDKTDEGYEVFRVRVSKDRKPQIGDKLCEIEDTEVLTSKGWVKYPDINMNHEIAILHDGVQIIYEKPKALHKFAHNDMIYTVSDDIVDFAVTLEHKMYVQKRNENKYQLRTAKNIVGEEIAYKMNGIWYGKEGHNHPSDDKIKEAVNSETEMLPYWIWNLGMEASTRVLRSIKTTGLSKRRAGEIQRLCLHSGCSGIVRLESYKLANLEDTYKVDINWQSHPVYAKRRENITEYRGYVYCMEVSSNVYYRRRNGKACWSGNSSRSGQKGVIGMLYHQADMPFTKDGVVPDLIMNPQAIPSRMTMAQLMECITGKSGALEGKISDSTTFTDINVDSITKALGHAGFEEYGKEEMYNGFTGEKMEAKIFIGPTYYQRLKHIVEDKIHARATGAVQMLTRQPLEGRAREGGLRFGEMERDAMIAHGTVKFLKERFYECSDKYSVYICDICGHMSVSNIEEGLFRCQSCNRENQESSISRINMPYSAKLLIHEIMSMGISLRVFPEKYKL